MPDPSEGDLIRVADAKKTYLGGKMSLRWWYRQVETAALPHFRAGGAVLLRVADVEAFVAGFFRAKVEPKKPITPIPRPEPKSRPLRGGLRFFNR